MSNGQDVEELSEQMEDLNMSEDVDAATKRSRHFAGPFGSPRRAKALSKAFLEDVIMEDVEEKELAPTTRVANAPAVPDAPMLKECTMEARRVFMRAYQEYVRKVSSMQTTTSRPFVMPVGSCIAENVRRDVARFDLEKPVEEISELVGGR